MYKQLLLIEGDQPATTPPRATNRVWMRVTSGQTANEIMDNIAPPGQGERQMLLMSQQDVMSPRQSEVAPPFIVVHEDELVRAQQGAVQVPLVTISMQQLD